MFHLVIRERSARTGHGSVQLRGLAGELFVLVEQRVVRCLEALEPRAAQPSVVENEFNLLIIRFINAGSPYNFANV